MKIRVTANDIQCGAPRKCNFCPVALALERTLGYHVNVGPYDVWLHNDQDDSVPLPAKAVNFIKAFDAGRKVKPFTFNLSL